MLDGLKLWRSGDADAAEAARAQVLAAGPPPSGVEDDRGSERFIFTGAEVFLFLPGDERYRLRLKDVSSTGLSGLTDAPLSLGERIIVQFEEMLMPAAEVVWVQRVMAGFRMVNPLPLARIKRLAERHAEGAAWSPAMRAGSDLHAWWTDVDEQKKGRAPKLRAGGHKHPIAR